MLTLDTYAALVNPGFENLLAEPSLISSGRLACPVMIRFFYTL